MPNDNALDEFIATWAESAASERANYQLFLTGLCQLLELPAPQPATADPTQDTYSFEHPVTFHHADGTTSTGFIDLYRRGAFVLETKQGVTRSDAPAPLSEAAKQAQGKAKKGHGVRGTAAWDTALQKARTQAENYARALPAAEGRPPFVVVVDVGHCIELYAEFSRSGGAYVPFPDPRTHRILLKDLRDPEIRERLRKLWLDPLDLDPSRRAAKVTREIADALAKLAKSLEASTADVPSASSRSADVSSASSRSADVSSASSSGGDSFSSSGEEDVRRRRDVGDTGGRRRDVGGTGYSPKAVAEFLMRCLFTMFAEDVKLLPHKAFQKLLRQVADAPEKFQPAVEDLWRIMNTGGFHSASMETILRFNGGLFATPSALPLNKDQLQFLAEAAEKDWRDVEPAIFGTLLERALDPHERHKLGAHYTPRAYVERLVLPTIIEPLREEWENVQAAAFTLAAAGKEKEAHKEIHAFHRRLCAIRVLDPACGSGNFLYVTLEHLKRLEGELFNTLHDLGESQTLIEAEGLTVDPHQLLGIEINPRAAVIAELVLWIGYLQWHYRTHGDLTPPEPVIKNFRNIQNRDAVLDYDKQEIVLDEKTHKPLTRWDGRTTKTHPVTGEQVPDDTARIPVYKYTNPRPAQWPEADYVVGNPPFIGTARMRDALGDGYTECIRATIKEVPESSDFVMYWWNHAAHLVRQGKLKRFGFITTNSIRQTFNRRILERHMTADNPVSIVFAIPDHPWVDSSDGAAVRIAMTVANAGSSTGQLKSVIDEIDTGGDERALDFVTTEGGIASNLSIGAAITSAVQLLANEDLSNRGVCLFGAGFIVNEEEARSLGFQSDEAVSKYIKPYLNGRDITQYSRSSYVIDAYGLDADQLQKQVPSIYQLLLNKVKPERDANKRASRKKNWWLFGETNPKLRLQLKNLSRYIATVETSKHRFFVFLDAEILPDNMLVNIALDDAYALGVLSSRPHVTWSLATGGRLGVGNDPRYNKTRCFETFPFPDATEAQKARIRELGERLDAHRKSRQALHPALTMTGMYNVLEKLRGFERTADVPSASSRTADVPSASSSGAASSAGGEDEGGEGGRLRERQRRRRDDGGTGERLDAHRKVRQDLYAGLTMTDMYTVPEKLRGFERTADVPSASSSGAASLAGGEEEGGEGEGQRERLGRRRDDGGTGERLDAHRKVRQDLYAGLTMTGMYNVLEKLRGFERTADVPSASSSGAASSAGGEEEGGEGEGQRERLGRRRDDGGTGERLDAHRKVRQDLYAGLTMTGMYNVLEKLRGFERTADVPSASSSGAASSAGGEEGERERERQRRRRDVGDTLPRGLDYRGDISIRWGRSLPHWTQDGVAYFVTFRLADSLPRAVGEAWLSERAALEEAAGRAEGRERVELERHAQELMSEKFLALLDQGYGGCVLKDPAVAQIVADALCHFDDERYRLWAWCIMPNHVHVVVEPLPGQELSTIVRSWKTFTAREINALQGTTGSVWQKEHFDHAIRDQGSFEQKIAYTLVNPTAAGLEDWPWTGQRTADVPSASSRTADVPSASCSGGAGLVGGGGDEERRRRDVGDTEGRRRDDGGTMLTPKEREIHEQGLVSVLKEIHDALDAAVCDAYGWPHDLSDEQILERLVALNAERAAEEKRGIIRYLRPDFQDPKFAQQTEFAPAPEDADTPAPALAAPKAKAPWPAALPDQINAVRAHLRQSPVPSTSADIAKAFKAAKAPRIQEILQALVALGHATPAGPTHYRAT